MAELTTLDRVKRYLGMNDPAESSEDETLGEFVASSSAWFERQIGRSLAVAAHTDRFEGDGTSETFTRYYPIVAVTAITVRGEPVLAGGISIAEDRVVLTGAEFARGAPVEITYTAGLVDVPEDIQQAVAMHAAMQYREKSRAGHASISLGGEALTYQPQGGNPQFAFVMSVAQSYRRFVL